MEIEIIEKFKEYYTDLDMFDQVALGVVYEENIQFTDPIHSLNGLSSLHEYFKGMADNVEHCTFDFHRQVSQESSAYLEWNMKLTMKGSQKIIVAPGVTYIEFGDKVSLHRDYFDAGAMFYENVPILRSIIRYIKKRIAS